MLAKLENKGPFQFFFTLSCADSRWNENFSSILSDQGVTIHYSFNSEGDEETLVEVESGKLIPLKEYLESYVNESQHELIRTHVLNASRNYNHRVKAFIRDIIMDKSNPMAVEFYSTKVEFQGRGAGHNHGVLWVNLDKLEYSFQNEDGQLCFIGDALSKFDSEAISMYEIKKSS